MLNFSLVKPLEKYENSLVALTSPFLFKICKYKVLDYIRVTEFKFKAYQAAPRMSLTLHAYSQRLEGKRLLPLRSWVKHLFWIHDTYVKRVSQRSTESRGFSPGTMVSSSINVTWVGG